jgi:hypothetical protein
MVTQMEQGGATATRPKNKNMVNENAEKQPTVQIQTRGGRKTNKPQNYFQDNDLGFD